MPPTAIHQVPGFEEVRMNTEHDRAKIFEKYGGHLPDNWKTFADGHLATHMYRLIDHAHGSDLRDPPLSAAMEGKLVPGPHGVDFNGRTLDRAR